MVSKLYHCTDAETWKLIEQSGKLKRSPSIGSVFLGADPYKVRRFKSLQRFIVLIEVDATKLVQDNLKLSSDSNPDVFGDCYEYSDDIPINCITNKQFLMNNTRM